MSDMAQSQKTVLRPMSEEQRNIVEKVKDGINIAVDAVPGSGKTTTILHIAQHYPNKKIIALMYNKDLKEETREKIKLLGLKGIECHSYHSLMYKYYEYDGKVGTFDTVMKHHLIYPNNSMLKKAPGKVQLDMLIIDEAQDMCKLYYLFVQMFLEDYELNPQLVLLGDRYQKIYDYRKQPHTADERFLTLPDKSMEEGIPYNAIEFII
jgi:superfamily I DNA/RNA helicase